MNYIDSINGVADLSHGTARLARGKTLNIIGWAVDSNSKKPAGKVYIDIDGKLYATKYGFSRPDVVAALKVPEYEKSGFSASIPAPEDDKDHQLTLKILSSDGSSYYVGMKAAFVIQ